MFHGEKLANCIAWTNKDPGEPGRIQLTLHCSGSILSTDRDELGLDYKELASLRDFLIEMLRPAPIGGN